MNCIEEFDTRIKRLEKLTAAIPELVRTVDTKLSASSDELKDLGGKVTQNRENIVEQENSVKLLSERNDEPPTSYFDSQLQSGGNRSSLDEVIMKQAHFNTAIQLGNSPTMIFGGELHKYVQFITMFRNSFDETINDPLTLYQI